MKFLKAWARELRETRRERRKKERRDRKLNIHFEESVTVYHLGQLGRVEHIELK